MEKLKKITLLFLISAQIFVLQAQESNSDNFSLQQAIDYALAHNQNYQNAILDVKSAEYRNKEVTGIGLPQINANADLKDYLSIPTSLIPAEIFGGQPGTFQPVKFGTKYNASVGVTISQIIFNSDYIVGLEAAKEFVALQEKNLQRSKVETVAAITKAYFGAVLTRERLIVVDANIERIKKSYDEAKAANEAGMVEKLDVDRLELTYNNALSERDKNSRAVGYTETLLKFQMGYDIKKPITLTDKISENLVTENSISEQTSVNYELRPEYALMQTQLRISNLELKRYKYQYLPSINAYGSFQEQAQRTQFDIFDITQPWFPIGLIGATLNIPIFNGGQKHFKIQQSKIGITKVNNSIEFLKSSIDTEVENYSYLYKNALISLETQKKNKVLAESIFNTSKLKYQEGVGSNMDLVIAQASLRDAEISYLNAVYELILAKTDYLKATGNLVK